MADTSKLTPYQRIMRAAKAGQGVRLSAAEVAWLARDHAIITCARKDDARVSENIAEIQDRIAKEESNG